MLNPREFIIWRYISPRTHAAAFIEVRFTFQIIKHTIGFRLRHFCGYDCLFRGDLWLFRGDLWIFRGDHWLFCRK